MNGSLRVNLGSVLMSECFEVVLKKCVLRRVLKWWAGSPMLNYELLKKISGKHRTRDVLSSSQK